MGKQPYIPLYIGDWEQDTNCLSIYAEGAWLKVVFKCWKNAGVFMSSYESLARLCKVDSQTFASILLEWKTNNICDVEEREDGTVLIICRRLAREAKISAVRSENGSKGGSKTQANIKQNKKSALAKVEQTHEYEDEIEDENKKVKESDSILLETGDPPPLSEPWFKNILDEMTLEQLSISFKGIDVPDQWEKFKVKVRGSPGEYIHRDVGSIRLAFQYQLRNCKPEKNGTHQRDKKRDASNNSIIESGKEWGSLRDVRGN